MLINVDKTVMWLRVRLEDWIFECIAVIFLGVGEVVKEVCCYLYRFPET
jgi:hypothetical protein